MKFIATISCIAMLYLLSPLQAQERAIKYELEALLSKKVWSPYVYRINDTLFSQGISYEFVGEKGNIIEHKISDTLCYCIKLVSISRVFDPVLDESKLWVNGCNPLLCLYSKSKHNVFLGKILSESYLGPTMLTIKNESTFSYTMNDGSDFVEIYYRLAEPDSVTKHISTFWE